MAMTTLPSALKGNLPGASETIRHRAPKFEKHLKPTRNVQFKPLQVERRFSHYEQKIANAPIDRFSTKIPRRLQTRKLSRLRKPMYDDERLKWNERLAAWLKEDQTSTVEYIKFTDQFNIIEKHLYYCSACHEFFHLNLKERENNKGCPRHRNRHEDYVRPVSVRKVKKPRRRQPAVLPKDPFGDRSNLNIPSLLPPKPARKVLAGVPPLPPIPKVPSRKNVAPPAPSHASTQRLYPSPVSTTPAFTPIVVNDDPLPSPTKFENIPEKPPTPPKAADSAVWPKEEKPQEEAKAKAVVTIPQPSPAPTEDLSGDESPSPPPPQIIEHPDIEEEGRNSEKISVVSFNRHELNGIYECSDVESVQQETALDPEDNCGVKATNYEDDDSDDVLEFVDDPEVEVELQIQSEECPEEAPSPARTRPRPPPPPDLPDLDFIESPDFPPVKKKPPLKKRKAIMLPSTKPEPKPLPPKEDKPKIHRMTSEELARRMRKAKEMNGYRQKYAFGTDNGQNSVVESDYDDDSSNFDLHENSFLEKYCLVSSKQLKACKRVFKEFDRDEDGLLKTEEVVNAMHKMFSPKVIDDTSMCYIFRILETSSFDMFSERMNLKLFAIVVSLAQRISELDSYMKHLIGRVNTEVVDWKIHEARSLFEYTMRRDTNGTYKVPMESLWLELHAGGISKENELQARMSLAHMKEMDLLDFLAYLPLFLLVHSNVVDNPLNFERNL